MAATREECASDLVQMSITARRAIPPVVPAPDRVTRCHSSESPQIGRCGDVPCLIQQFAVGVGAADLARLDGGARFVSVHRKVRRLRIRNTSSTISSSPGGVINVGRTNLLGTALVRYHLA